jgi:hypothetical protein
MACKDRIVALPRLRPLAVAFAATAVVYTIANVVFYYDGFFQYLHHGVSMRGFGIFTRTDAPGHISFLPLSRFVVFAATLGALVWCARALFRGDARARIVSFFLCFGWIAPQARYLELYLEGFHAVPAWQAWIGSSAVVLVPAAILASPSVAREFAPHETSLSWAALPWGKGRLLALGVLLPWMFYAADNFLMGWSWWYGADAGLALGALAATASILGFIGLVRLRTWAVLAALASGALGSGLLLSLRRPAREELFDGFFASNGALMLAAAPTVLVVVLSWPFLQAIGRKLREDS